MCHGSPVDLANRFSGSPSPGALRTTETVRWSLRVLVPEVLVPEVLVPEVLAARPESAVTDHFALVRRSESRFAVSAPQPVLIMAPCTQIR